MNTSVTRWPQNRSSLSDTFDFFRHHYLTHTVPLHRAFVLPVAFVLLYKKSRCHPSADIFSKRTFRNPAVIAGNGHCRKVNHFIRFAGEFHKANSIGGALLYNWSNWSWSNGNYYLPLLFYKTNTTLCTNMINSQ